ncbi:hypothetical protein ACFV4N_42270, partial [Actinosynnema sp. NPDC059797]
MWLARTVCSTTADSQVDVPGTAAPQEEHTMTAVTRRTFLLASLAAGARAAAGRAPSPPADLTAVRGASERRGG